MLRPGGRREGRGGENARGRRGGLAAPGAAGPGSRLRSVTRAGRAAPTRPARRRLRPRRCERRSPAPRELATRALPQPRASAEPPPPPVRPIPRAAALRLRAALSRLTPVLYLERAEPSSQQPPRRALAPALALSLARGSSCPPAAARPGERSPRGPGMQRPNRPAARRAACSAAIVRAGP